MYLYQVYYWKMSNKLKDIKTLGVWACCHDWETFSHLLAKLSLADCSLNPTIMDLSGVESHNKYNLQNLWIDDQKLYMTYIEATSTTLKLSQNKIDIISGVILVNKAYLVGVISDSWETASTIVLSVVFPSTIDYFWGLQSQTQTKCSIIFTIIMSWITNSITTKKPPKLSPKAARWGKSLTLLPLETFLWISLLISS